MIVFLRESEKFYCENRIEIRVYKEYGICYKNYVNYSMKME